VKPKNTLKKAPFLLFRFLWASKENEKAYIKELNLINILMKK